MRPPSERTELEREIAHAVMDAHEDAMRVLCSRVAWKQKTNDWPEEIVRDAVEHYGGWVAVDAWDEYADGDA